MYISLPPSASSGPRSLSSGHAQAATPPEAVDYHAACGSTIITSLGADVMQASKSHHRSRLRPMTFEASLKHSMKML